MCMAWNGCVCVSANKNEMLKQNNDFFLCQWHKKKMKFV